MTSEAQSFSDDTPGEAPVRGFLHRAERSGGGFLVLTHGAGGNCSAPLLVALAEKLAASGLTVLRCDLPVSPAASARRAFALRCQDGPGWPAASG